MRTNAVLGDFLRIGVALAALLICASPGLAQPSAGPSPPFGPTLENPDYTSCRKKLELPIAYAASTLSASEAIEICMRYRQTTRSAQAGDHISTETVKCWSDGFLGLINPEVMKADTTQLVEIDDRAKRNLVAYDEQRHGPGMAAAARAILEHSPDYHWYAYEMAFSSGGALGQIFVLDENRRCVAFKQFVDAAMLVPILSGRW
ncbi:MAG: hypothetical protein JO209_06780 [Acidisphaera sp.]|nr:hypothetical protein [Acidisphaera sp.]